MDLHSPVGRQLAVRARVTHHYGGRPHVHIEIYDPVDETEWSLYCDLDDMDELVAAVLRARRDLRVALHIEHPANPGEAGLP
jgi:hypothetical protein